MFRPNGSLLRRALLLGLVAVAGTAMAQEGAILGQSWPEAADQSKAPGWHAYVTVKDGVKYIQINDAAGRPHAAIATAGDQILKLPIGGDQVNVAPSAATAPHALSSGQTVYDDGTVIIQATTSPSNVTTFNAVNRVACDPDGCNHTIF